MGQSLVLLIGILIFITFIFLFWLFTRNYVKKEYGIKMWKNGSAKLSYWQAAILYSAGLTFVTMFILQWVEILKF